MGGEITYREFIKNSSPEPPPPVHIADEELRVGMNVTVTAETTPNGKLTYVFKKA